MNIRLCYVSRSIRYFLTLTLTMMLLGSASFAMAVPTGPVSAASLPGGATVTDSDDGTGETWGKGPNGRTFTYSNFDSSQFNSLTWQVVDLSAAFDGAIDSPGETLTRNVSASTSAEQVWEGQTTIRHSNGGTSLVYIRARLDVTGSSFASDGGVDALTPSQFAITIYFEASLNGSTWSPALDFFNDYSTTPTDAGKALTSLDYGFYYELANAGISLAQHDSNMQARASEIVGKINFLTIDATNRLQGIESKLNDNDGKLLEIMGKFGPLATTTDVFSLAGNIDGLAGDINGLAGNIYGLAGNIDGLHSNFQDMQGVIVCMWVGMLCPPEVPPGTPNLMTIAQDHQELVGKVDSIKTELADIRDAIDNLPKPIQSIDMKVTEVRDKHEHEGDRYSEFWLLTTVAGSPADATVVGVMAILEDKKAGPSVVNVPFTTTPTSTGLQFVDVMPPGKRKWVKALVIAVERTVGSETQHGTTFVSEED